MSSIDKLLDPIPVPRMVKIHQKFDRPIVNDVGMELMNKLKEQQISSKISDGMKVAIAVGSRGVANLPVMVKTLVSVIKKAGGDPFVVPCMGSHGGATAEGQRDMLIGMGMDEVYIDAPIKATMETVVVGKSVDGLPANIDRYAYEADGIVIINRIKPHVAFRGPYESGLMKMVTIGLGKQKGADICHELGFGKMAHNIPAIGMVLIEKTNIISAVGVLENAYHETCQIEVMDKEKIEKLEPALQQKAKELAPKIYFDQLDVLIIDEIGKDISGSGFDTNMVGRYHTPYASGGPDITRISVLDITERSHGNGNGLGILDFTTKRAFDKFDFEMTYPNSLTSTVPTSVKIPMVLKNDKQAIQAAIKTCNILNKHQVRMVRIKNTVEVETIEVSENMIDGIHKNEYMKCEGEAYPLSFNERGSLLD